MSGFTESVVEDGYRKPTHLDASSFVEKSCTVHLMRVNEITLLSKLIGGQTWVEAEPKPKDAIKIFHEAARKAFR